jgi:hypothetical protein
MTNHPKNEIRRLHVRDADGKEFVVLEMVPLQHVQTYHGMRVERGRTRYELPDGTPVTRTADGAFSFGNRIATLCPEATGGHEST